MQGTEPARLSVGDGSWAYLPSCSPKMRAVEERARLLAPSDETVFLLGETGVGKDVVARLIHDHSPRRRRIFVHLNCSAVPEGLLESELFGHVRGAYTGASHTTPGQFEIASGGTLFLDEIGEISTRLQAKLLHVLQERRIYRVGGRWPQKVDVRILAATNRDLQQDLRSGAFRTDLFYRLSALTLRLPPLRERPEDIRPLAEHFFHRFAALYNLQDKTPPDDHFYRALQKSRWQGNVRELENVIKRYILLGNVDADQQAEERPEATPASVHPLNTRPVPLREATRAATERLERSVISRALNKSCWNRREAARELQISYRTLLYKIKGYSLRPDDGFESSETIAPTPFTR
jgi:two-component system, NtrC family, response regulator AtoC